MESDDAILRAFGFRIVGRPKDGPATWMHPSKPRHQFTYPQALHACQSLLQERIEDRKEKL